MALKFSEFHLGKKAKLPSHKDSPESVQKWTVKPQPAGDGGTSKAQPHRKEGGLGFSHDGPGAKYGSFLDDCGLDSE